MTFECSTSQESSQSLQTINEHLGQMSGERFDPQKLTIILPLDAHISSDAIVCSSKETAVSSVSSSRDEEVTMIFQASNPVLHTRANSNPEARPVQHSDNGRAI